MNEPITFYFDFSSAYSYFAAPKIDKLGLQFNREVEWNAIMLGPALAQSGNAPLMQQPLKNDYCKYDWERLAIYQNMPWELPKKFPIVSLAAARGFWWINDQDTRSAKAFAVDCFDLYFGQGIDISDPEVIAPFSEKYGFKKKQFLEAINTEKIKEVLKAKTTLAISKGMCGAPFFIVDNEKFWGADRLWMIKHWLKAGKW